jgi:outer membrane protein assembly factor BamE (lipoprotein component of BamABCDE complex)
VPGNSGILPDCQIIGSEVRQAAIGCKADERMWGDLVRAKGARAAGCCALLLTLALGGCGETFQRGYVLPEGALEQIPLGATQEQVLIVLGTPSTVATVSGEAFYYISQRAERAVAFAPTKITDQRVIAVYFDSRRRVERVASYGFKDGKLFEFISRTTPTAGSDVNFITALFSTLEHSRFGLPIPGN